MSDSPPDSGRGRSVTRSARRDFCLDLSEGLPYERRQRRVRPYTSSSSCSSSSPSGSRPRRLKNSPAKSLEWDKTPHQLTSDTVTGRIIPQSSFVEPEFEYHGLRSITGVLERLREPGDDDDGDQVFDDASSPDLTLIDEPTNQTLDRTFRSSTELLRDDSLRVDDPFSGQDPTGLVCSTPVKLPPVMMSTGGATAKVPPPSAKQTATTVGAPSTTQGTTTTTTRTQTQTSATVQTPAPGSSGTQTHLGPNRQQQHAAPQGQYANDILKHRIMFDEAVRYVGIDLADFDCEGFPADYLKDEAKEMQAHKKKLSTATAALAGLDTVYYEANLKTEGQVAYQALLRVIKMTMVHVKNLEDAGKDKENIRDKLLEQTLDIKRERVRKGIRPLYYKVEALTASLKEVAQAQPTLDRKLEALIERNEMYSKQADEYLRDIQSLYQDAAAAGLADEAAELEMGCRDLKFARTEAVEAIGALREQLNLNTRSASSKTRLVDLVHPVFNGLMTGSSLDIFTFSTEFKEYADAKGYTNAECVTILKKTCLQGPPKVLVQHKESLDEIWPVLLANYGNPMELIRTKIQEMKKIGKCDGASSKRREWAIDVHAKITRLHDIATEHGKTSELYHSEVVSQLRELMPFNIIKDFRDSIKAWEKENDTEICKEQVFLQFMEFLAKLIKEETFNMRFQAVTVTEEKAAAAKSTKPPDPTGKTSQPRPGKRTYANNPAPPVITAGKPPGAQPTVNKNYPRKPPQTTQGKAPTPQKPRTPAAPFPYEEPRSKKCVVCKTEHTHLFDCNHFQSLTHQDRMSLCGYLRICHRCLRLDSKVDFTDRREWYEKHVNNCITDWHCEAGNCSKAYPSRQKHIVMCEYHSNDNKNRLADFVNTLDQTSIGPNFKFFFMSHQQYNLTAPAAAAINYEPDVIPDKNEYVPSIYLVQTVPGDVGADLLVFFDNGCSAASLSTRAAKILNSETGRPGPTTLNIAGGKQIEIPYGEERFLLNLTSGKRAAMTGLKMDQITDVFPLWRLQEAFNEVNTQYLEENPDGPPLPEVDEKVGGKAVDIMVGIRYNQYFPVLNYMLPGGLAVYTAQFKTSSGNQGILGGCHDSWRNAHNNTQYMNPRAYFTSELRAYRVQQKSMMFVQEFEPPCARFHEVPLDEDDDELHVLEGDGEGDGELTVPETSKGTKKPTEPLVESRVAHPVDRKKFEIEKNFDPSPLKKKSADEDFFLYDGKIFMQPKVQDDFQCSNHHCGRHLEEREWLVPKEWDAGYSLHNVSQDETKFWQAENVANEVSCRCISCRNCSRCRDGDHTEAISLAEEADHAILEATVSYDSVNKRLVAKLPFIQDPAEQLRPNRFIAEKIFDRQMAMIAKNPDLRPDIIKAHDKLLLKGYVIPEDDLPADIKALMDTVEGPGYFIPWQIVFKPTSLSTPVRMVMNASSATPGGKSLNSILAKGANTLSKIYDTLLSFRSDRCALSCDVSMAYNGLRLDSTHLKFQRYLWRKDMDPSNPIMVMIILTLIYGVKPSGQQTTVGFGRLADYCDEHHPQHKEGSAALRKAYMDDVAVAAGSLAAAHATAASLTFVLALAQLKVKCFTFSGSSPEEAVSSDGTYVGLLGYKWAPEKDTIHLDVKDLYFGKPRRGVLPPTVCGDFSEQLKKNFTKREMIGMAAKVYDPLGLVTPIMSKIKLDLHEITDLKVDWDDALPTRLLSTWSENITMMQSLNQLEFKRAMIPHNAAKAEIHLIGSCDASIDISIATLHARVELVDGSFSCQLLTAKSKLVKGVTVPRAELKGAVLAATMSHVAKRSLGRYVKSITFVTDSTICLFWLHQDYRPLQVAVRNSVIEIRRFSLPEQWFHVETHNNIADLGTRPASVEELKPGSDWLEGKPWMKGPAADFPLRTVKDITLTIADKLSAAKEMKAPDIGGHLLDPTSDKVCLRYKFSKYPVDPCARKFPTSVGVLGMVLRVGDILKKRNPHKGNVLSAAEKARAENVFYKIGTGEVKQFCRKKDYEHISEEKDGILYFTGRVLDMQEYSAMENTMVDLAPLSFVKPILDRYSPLSYSIMVHCHQVEAVHQNAVSTLRESLLHAYILRGRDLAEEVRRSCPHCKRFKKKLLEVEMGKLHKHRLTIAPAFTFVGVDLAGPFDAVCEHQPHRSKVKIWAAVFKCFSTCAVSCHVMTMQNTPAFIWAYTRFAARYGHPHKLIMDAGGQLVKAAKEMEICLVDLESHLSTKYQVGLEHEIVPVGAHNANGQTERAIKDVKKLFYTVYRGFRLDVMGYETAFAWTCNEINNIPICLGSRYRDLDHLDLITPSRLLLGRNNKRAMADCPTLDTKDRMIEQMDDVYNSWWEAWQTEKLLTFIPQPKVWNKTGYEPKKNDIVVFKREDRQLGEPVWRTGRILEAKVNSDDHSRALKIEYKNKDPYKTAVFKTVIRSTRQVAVVHEEGALELIDQLNLAAKESNVFYTLTNLQTAAEMLNPPHSGVATSGDRKRPTPCSAAISGWVGARDENRDGNRELLEGQDPWSWTQESIFHESQRNHSLF